MEISKAILERIEVQNISKLAGDLIYCVAILGITGSKGIVEDELKSYLNRVEKNSECPFIVGFGIKEREDIVGINQIAHGAVVGSAIIHEMQNSNNPVEVIKNYIKKLSR